MLKHIVWLGLVILVPSAEALEIQWQGSVAANHFDFVENPVPAGTPMWIKFTLEGGSLADYRRNYSVYDYWITDVDGATEKNGVSHLEWELMPPREFGLRDNHIQLEVDPGSLSHSGIVRFEHSHFGLYLRQYDDVTGEEAAAVEVVFFCYPKITVPEGSMNGRSIIDVPSGPPVAHRPYQDLGFVWMQYDRVIIKHDELLPGDADANGTFNQLDLVQVSQAGRYAMPLSASWSEGDWNADGLFDSADIVSVLNSRTVMAPIPEPSAIILLLFALPFCFRKGDEWR